MSTANSFISDPLPIGSLIVDRLRVLDLTTGHLLRRASYKNIAKSLRRLDELLVGELFKTRDLIRALPVALDLPPEVVEHAIEETRRRTAEAQEAEEQARQTIWRAAFRPHAIILTERTVPQPFFVAAFIGIERLLRIDFDLALAPVTYTNQALAGIRRKLRRIRERGASRSGPPSWDNCELHAGSRHPVRSRWQRSRNTSACTPPCELLHRASPSTSQARNAASNHAPGAIRSPAPMLPYRSSGRGGSTGRPNQ